MRRRLVWWARAGAVVAGCIVLLLAALWGAGNTDPGRRLIERATYRLTGGQVALAGLGGFFPSRLTLSQLRLRDAQGVWLSADGVALTWSPSKLLVRIIALDDLRVDRLHVERAPVGGSGSGTPTVPHIEVGRFALETVELGAPLVGEPMTLTAGGALRLRSLTDADVELLAHRRDGDGDYAAHLHFDPARMDGSLQVHEPKSGPLEHLLSLPGLGALSATATLSGPRHAERIAASVVAGTLRAEVSGSIDLEHLAADLTYSLDASALEPRPGLAWEHAALHGAWHGPLSSPNGAGKLELAGLRIPGGVHVARLSANLSATAAHLAVGAVAEGLEIPGSAPRLLADDPLTLDATWALQPASHPLQLTATHRLFSLRGRTDTVSSGGAPLRGTASASFPDLQPLAALVGQDVRGAATVSADFVHSPDDDSLALDIRAEPTGGTAPWLAAVGSHAALKITGDLSAAGIKLQSLNFASDAGSLAANGTAARSAGAASFAGSLRDLKLRWSLEVPELGRLSPDLAGDLKGSGEITGSPTALAVDADLATHLSVCGSPTGAVQAQVHARGLPSTPGGTLAAHGMLDGAPLDVDAEVDRGPARGVQVVVRRADWKSAHVDGDLSTDAAFADSRGKLHLAMTRLDDLNRLLGSTLGGSVEATLGFLPVRGHTEAHLAVDGRKLVLGNLAGDVHLDAAGVANAMAVQLTAQLPALYGAPAHTAAAAVLDIESRAIRLGSLAIDYRGETLRLAAPAQLSFADGFAVDDLKLAMRDATFDVNGQFTPTLDVRASLARVDADLVNALSPGLLAAGTLDGRARLEGTIASPTGNVRLDATGVRFADDAAAGLPAADVHARARLAGDSAAIEATLSAGAGSQLKATGAAPLKADGTLDMKIGGKLDVGLVNPLLEARGLHAAGLLSVDATVTGSAAAPVVGGGITLTGGSVRDYAHGVSLSDIAATVAGDQAGLDIQSFHAKAGSGSVTATGTFGVLQHGMPIAIEIVAKNAQPVSSSIITANMNADLKVTGTVLERIDVTGRIDVNRATIGIPDSLPPDVAVLDVHRRGRPAAPATAKLLVIGIDLAIDAPQDILVQGRGLDAELGGEIKVSGTSDDLQVSGGFNLQRGTFSIAGNTLTLSTPGRVGFDGAGLRKKIDPTLDFTATTTVTDSNVTLRITGFADAPQFAFTSNPPLPQDEIMARLLFGESAAQLSALQVAQIGAALATLSGVGGSGSNPLVKLQKTLGLDRLSVGSNTTTTATGATENSGAAISAGRYVTKRIYIEGKQSTAGTSQVQVDVDLTKHLKLQTRLGNGTATTQGTTPENDPGSSIGITYQFEY